MVLKFLELRLSPNEEFQLLKRRLTEMGVKTKKKNPSQRKRRALRLQQEKISQNKNLQVKKERRIAKQNRRKIRVQERKALLRLKNSMVISLEQQIKQLEKNCTELHKVVSAQMVEFTLQIRALESENAALKKELDVFKVVPQVEEVKPLEVELPAPVPVEEKKPATLNIFTMLEKYKKKKVVEEKKVPRVPPVRKALVKSIAPSKPIQPVEPKPSLTSTLDSKLMTQKPIYSHVHGETIHSLPPNVTSAVSSIVVLAPPVTWKEICSYIGNAYNMVCQRRNVTGLYVINGDSCEGFALCQHSNPNVRFGFRVFGGGAVAYISKVKRPSRRAEMFEDLVERQFLFLKLHGLRVEFPNYFDTIVRLCDKFKKVPPYSRPTAVTPVVGVGAVSAAPRLEISSTMPVGSPHFDGHPISEHLLDSSLGSNKGSEIDTHVRKGSLQLIVWDLRSDTFLSSSEESGDDSDDW